MIKLMVSDLDGTLLPYSRESVSKEAMELVHEIIVSGVTFAVSSGRTFGELIGFLPGLCDKIYYTCCDGALTIKDGKVIYARKIEASDIEQFFRHKSTDFSFVLHGAFENYGYGKLPAEADRFNCKPINGIFEIKDKIFKITSFGDTINLPEYSGLRTHWDGTNKTAQYVNRYCSKGTALSDLQTRLMLTKYDTAVFGDRGNDVCMVKGSKLSYCIGDRCAELSKACTYQFDDIESALAHFIDSGVNKPNNIKPGC